MPCMPLHQPSAVAQSCMHMPELFRDILQAEDSLSSPTSTLQEESPQNTGGPVGFASPGYVHNNTRPLRSVRAGLRGQAWESQQVQGQPSALRVGTRGGPVPATWFSVAAVEQEPQRLSNVGRSPLVVAAQPQRIRRPRTAVPPRLQERLQAPREYSAELLQRSRSPPRRRVTPTPAAGTSDRNREPSEGSGWRSGGERVQARLPALLSWMQAGSSIISGRGSRGTMQAFAARDQDNARQGRMMPWSR